MCRHVFKRAVFKKQGKCIVAWLLLRFLLLLKFWRFMFIPSQCRVEGTIKLKEILKMGKAGICFDDRL